MTAIAIGPFALAADRLAAILGIAAFLVLSALLARLVESRLERWSGHALIAGLVGARLGHVVENLDGFLVEPWRIFAVWQGGFSPLWAAVAIAAISLFHLRSARMAAAAALVVASSFGVWGAFDRFVATPEPIPAPTHALARLDGPPATTVTTVALTQWGGRPLVVNLWATWCPPCRREMPVLAEAARSRDDVAFVFVNQGEPEAAIRDYLDRAGIDLPVVLLDPTGTLGAHYGTPGLPATLFIRADGTLAAAHVGEISREVLARRIDRLTDGR